MKRAAWLARGCFHWGYCCREGVKGEMRIWTSGSSFHLITCLFWSIECGLERRPASIWGEKSYRKVSSLFQTQNMSWMDSKAEKFASACHEGVNDKKSGLLGLWNPDGVFITDCGGRFWAKMKGLSNNVCCGMVRKQPSCKKSFGLGRLSNLTGLPHLKPLR